MNNCLSMRREPPINQSIRRWRRDRSMSRTNYTRCVNEIVVTDVDKSKACARVKVFGLVLFQSIPREQNRKKLPVPSSSSSSSSVAFWPMEIERGIDDVQRAAQSMRYDASVQTIERGEACVQKFGDCSRTKLPIILFERPRLKEQGRVERSVLKHCA